MARSKALLTLGTLAMSLGVSHSAKASGDMALSFELPPSAQADIEAATPPTVAPDLAAAESPPDALISADAPLPIPSGAENPPMASDNARPNGVFGGLDAIAIDSVTSVQALLPSPPPVPDYVQAVATAITPAPAPATVEQTAPDLSEKDVQSPIALFIGIQEKTFESEVATATAVSLTVEAAKFEYSFDNFHTLFAGGTDSLVARAVGSAEGTRTPEGHKNPAYYGHVDPGNGVWNLGTFSYQHGAVSPEEADDKQLRRLLSQTEKLRQIALRQGLQLSQEELLNGIDLANQAPLAALDRGGYVDWLKEARNLGMQGAEAIVWARTRSFIDPDTQRWNAPGLGNNVYSISHDQERRTNAIARAVNAFNAQTQIAIAPAPTSQLHQSTGDSPADLVSAGRSVEPIELAFSVFSSSNNLAAPTTAQVSEAVAEKTIVASVVPTDNLPDATALSRSGQIADFRSNEEDVSQQAQPADEVSQTNDQSRLVQLSHNLVNIFTRSKPTSFASTVPSNDGTAAAVNVTSATPQPPSMPVLSSMSAATGMSSSAAVYQPDVGFAQPRIWVPESTPHNDEPTVPSQTDDPLALADVSAFTSTVEVDLMQAISDESTPLETLESETQSLITEASNTNAAPVHLDIAAPITLPASDPQQLDAAVHDPQRSTNEQTKAPVTNTGAESLQQRTLDSLEELQRRLRAEAAADE